MLTRRAFVRGMLWLPPTLLLGASCSGSDSGTTATVDYTSLVPLGGVMTFRLTASSRYDLPNPRRPNETSAEVFFSLLDGLVAIEPLDPQWGASRQADRGTLYQRQVVFKPNLPQTFELQVRLDRAGDLQLAAGITMTISGSKISGDYDALFLRVTSEGTQVQRMPFSPTA